MAMGCRYAVPQTLKMMVHVKTNGFDEMNSSENGDTREVGVRAAKRVFLKII